MITPAENDTGERSDEALMEALINGDDHALAALMQRWEVGVKAFLLRLGVPSADVEDVAQEAFVRLYQKRDRYRSGSPFKPWLLTLAGNLGRNRLRWRFRRREDSIEAMDAAQPGGFDPLDPSARSASDLAEKANLARDVRAAVDALPVNPRQAVTGDGMQLQSRGNATLPRARNAPICLQEPARAYLKKRTRRCWNQPSLWVPQPITPGKGSLAALACAPAVRAVARSAFASA